MAVEIKEVVSRSQLKKFVDFPNKMYKNVDAYVPFMFSDEMATFTPKNNPAYEFCETKLFLAYRGKEIVGRIAGLVNHAANKKWGTNSLRFTRFDFIDDYEVSSALFNKVVEWGKTFGFDKITGPIGFTDVDHEGMLIEGFDELNMTITFYNHPYYIDHMVKLGLEKEVDWVEYQLLVQDTIDEKFEKISDYLAKRGGYQLVEYTDRKTLAKDAFEAFKVIDVAFSVLHGTVPLTDAIINKLLSDYIPIINLKYVCSVKTKDGKIIGFAVMCPSFAKALKKSNGRLFPFGFINVLKSLFGKNDTLEMYFIAILPEYQSKGIPAIIVNHLARICRENGIKICETGPELEKNEAVQGLWKGFDTRQHRRRRCWKKDI